VRQTTNTVLMVEPSAFGHNPDSARTNAFMQQASGRDPREIQAAALGEFESLVERLDREGVEVLVYRDDTDSPSPDAVFPNNWVTFHDDGRAILYPMEPPNRRRERRREILDWLSREGNFLLTEVIDLSQEEAEGRFLEGTGSMVLDRPGRTIYASISPRTTPSLLHEYADRFGFGVVVFHAEDRGGIPLYHTNVALALGAGVAVLCGNAVPVLAERRALMDSLERSGREVVDIDMSQLAAFAGNMIALEDRAGAPLLAMSERALSSLGSAQRKSLERHARLVTSSIPTIEEIGGGSVRCMLAEVFLPRR
jgi:hypothetical protein